MEVISHKNVSDEFLIFDWKSNKSEDEWSDLTSPSKNFDNESNEEFWIKPQNDLNIKIVVKKLGDEFEIENNDAEYNEKYIQDDKQNLNECFKSKINKVRKKH